jgi:hypothetical protein
MAILIQAREGVVSDRSYIPVLFDRMRALMPVGRAEALGPILAGILTIVTRDANVAQMAWHSFTAFPNDIPLNGSLRCPPNAS